MLLHPFVKLDSALQKAVSRSSDSRINSAALFIVRFLLLSIPLYVVLLSGWQLSQLISLTDLLARQLLSLSGIEHSVVNGLIALPVENGTWAAFINWDCTGWKSMYAFFALVFATPMKGHSSFHAKLYAMLLIPVIYAINLLRIWFMFYVASVNLDLFPLVHAVVWSWGLVAVVLVLWFIWLRRCR